MPAGKHDWFCRKLQLRALDSSLCYSLHPSTSTFYYSNATATIKQFTGNRTTMPTESGRPICRRAVAQARRNASSDTVAIDEAWYLDHGVNNPSIIRTIHLPGCLPRSYSL